MADNSQQGFLNTLFQWTVKNSSSETPTKQDSTSETPRPMSEEDKKWLDGALSNMTVNPVERLKICIKQLKENSENAQNSKEFLNELCGWTEELDLAKDFFTVGGLDILSPLLDHQDDEIRCQACSLMATLVQNNDQCQRIIVQSGLQEKLLKIIDESNNPELQTKALTAISALIRGYVLGQLQLQKYQGHKVLIRALSRPIPRLQMKLCFLINIICASSAHMKKIFFENGALEEFVRLFTNETCPDSQNALEAILTLSSAKENSLIQLDSVLLKDLKDKLNKRLELLSKDTDAQDEVVLINKINMLLGTV